MSKTTNILSLSTKVTEEVIRTELTEDQLAQMKDKVSTNMLKQFDTEEELNEIKAEYKTKLDSLKKDTKSNLRNIRNGFIDEVKKVHNIPDDERLVIEFFDEEGTKVGERKMTPDEKPSIRFKQTVN